MEKKIPEIPVTYMKGLLSVELPMTSQICDIGIQTSEDGRIWLCVDGVAFIRFKPLSDKMIKLLSNKS